MRDLPHNELVRFVCHDGRYALLDPNLLRMHAVLSRIWEDTGIQKPFEEVEDIRHLEYTSLLQMEALLLLAFAAFRDIMNYVFRSPYSTRWPLLF